MNSFDLTHFQAIVSERCGVSREEMILVGVSGGADSLFLLRNLQLAGFRVTAATFNHRLRPSAGDEVAFVRGLCAAWDLPFVCGEGDVRGFARENKLSIEEAARVCRYQFLFAAAERIGAAAVAVGHHADDQAETVLMHFLRGSGLDGLAGMAYRAQLSQWSAAIPLIRPLLEIRRGQIEQWCTENGIQPVSDASNFEMDYLRNRIRGELLPELEACYNPNLRRGIARTALTIQADLAVLEQLTAERWAQCVDSEKSSADVLVFRREAFLAQPLGLQQRLLRKGAFTLRPAARDFGYECIAEGVAFFFGAAEFDRRSFPENLELARERDALCLARTGLTLNLARLPQLPSKGSILLEPGASLQLDGWRVSVRRVDLDLESVQTDGANGVQGAATEQESIARWIQATERNSRMDGMGDVLGIPTDQRVTAQWIQAAERDSRMDRMDDVLRIPTEQESVARWVQAAERDSRMDRIDDVLGIPTDQGVTARWVQAAQNDRWTGWLDADQLAFPLTLRAALPGERFAPLGMHGRQQKLSDFWINQKLPQALRQHYPLVADANGIVWIPGFRLAERCRLSAATTRAVEIRFQRQDSER